MADEPDWGQTEKDLKAKAGQWYDPTMLDDVKRNSSYGAGGGADNTGDWVNRIANKAQLRGSNEANSTYEANGQGGSMVGPSGGGGDGGGGGGGNSGMNDMMKQWMDQSAAQSANSQKWMDESRASMAEQNQRQIDATNASTAQNKLQMDQTAAASEQNRQRNTALYGQLMQRAQQGTEISANDPAIKAQTDAYSASTDRATRNMLADQAESGGPNANLRGEQRMAAEHSGQAVGGFRAELMGRELSSKRAEIADALHSMQGQLTADQTQELQNKLGIMDDAIKNQGLSLQGAGQTQNYDLGLHGANLGQGNLALGNRVGQANFMLGQGGLANQSRGLDLQGRGQDQQYKLGQGQLDLGNKNAGNQNEQFYNELGLRRNQAEADNAYRFGGYGE